MGGQETIRWPEKHDPKKTSAHVRNELDMPVSPEAVWPWLVRAKLWPTLYPNSENVVIEGGAADLKLGSKFRWKTFGVTLDSKVEEFVPPERLGWSSRSMGIDSHHAWLIGRKPSGCHVLTEETVNGWLARLSNALRPKYTEKLHQVWLEGLLEKAKGGPP